MEKHTEIFVTLLCICIFQALEWSGKVDLVDSIIYAAIFQLLALFI